MRRGRLGLGAILLTAWASAWLHHAWVTDDAFFTFRTVRHVLAGLGPRWNVDERVAAYTHPLWMGLQAAVAGALGVGPERAAWLLSLLGTLAAIALLAATRAPLAAAGASLLLLAASSVFDFTASGLEGPLALLLTLATTHVATTAPPARRTVGLLALGTSLLALTRPEAALLPLPALALATAAVGRAAIPALLAGLLPLLGWAAFALVFYGTPLPNTYYAKVPTGSAASALGQHGRAYVLASLRWDPVGAAALAGAAVVAVRGDRAARAVALGAALVIVWVARVGDYMAGRMLLVPIAAAVGLLAARLPTPTRPAVPLAVVLLLHLPFALGAAPRLGRPTRPCDRVCLDDERDRDVRPGMGWTWSGVEPVEPDQPPVRGTLRAVAVSEVSGIWADAHDDVHVLDRAGLGDALLARLPVTVPATMPGHWSRPLPEGYVAAVADGDLGRIVDPDVRAYAVHVDRVVRGPLWDPERWRSIAHLLWTAPRFEGEVR